MIFAFDTKRKTKGEINNRDYIKFKKFLHNKGNHQIKRQATEREKTFANFISDKGQIFKISE